MRSLRHLEPCRRPQPYVLPVGRRSHAQGQGDAHRGRRGGGLHRRAGVVEGDDLRSRQALPRGTLGAELRHAVPVAVAATLEVEHAVSRARVDVGIGEQRDVDGVRHCDLGAAPGLERHRVDARGDLLAAGVVEIPALVDEPGPGRGALIGAQDRGRALLLHLEAPALGRHGVRPDADGRGRALHDHERRRRGAVQLRPHERGDRRPDRGEQRIELRPGAGGRAGVAMPRDDVEGHLRAVGVLGGRARPVRRGQRRGARRVEVLESELVGQDLLDRRDHHRGRGLGVVVAERGHRPRLGVEAARRAGTDVPVEPTGAALEDLAELVHQHVVGDVGPAEAVRVVGVDRADCSGSLVLRVAVRRGGVVHEGHPDARLIGR